MYHLRRLVVCAALLAALLAAASAQDKDKDKKEDKKDDSKEIDKAHEALVYSLAVSPDGKMLASGSYDKTIKLWELPSMKFLKKLEGHTDNLYCVVFNKDGTELASSSQDKTIRIEGHTDNVPIGKPLQARYASNWELSAERATTVARFLHEATQLEPAVFEAVGLGEYHPVADNRSVKGRSKNRRIEIVLYPRVRTIAKELPKGTATVR